MDFRRLFSNYTPIQPEQTPDDATREGVFNYDLENKKHDIAFKKSYLKTRKWVGFWTFLLVWVWLASMLFFVYAETNFFRNFWLLRNCILSLHPHCEVEQR